jgi:hypothetical protein
MSLVPLFKMSLVPLFKMSLVPLVEDELFTLPKHLSSPLVFSGVHILQSFIFHVGIVNHSLSVCPSFGHCFNCPLILQL